jgi:alanyl-tRNA synthetase
MLREEAIKKRFKEKAQREPEKHYPVRTLKEEGFTRRRCRKCGGYFWAYGERDVCGEPSCEGGYTFIGNTPAREKMDYIQTWKRFARLFEKLGYTPIPRYPVVARWRSDAEFVQASIYDFQPYCVTGEVEPPANPLVVPQFCLRFNDTDNVGITGRHYTGFVMIGQHAFEKPENYAPEEYLEHIYEWLVQGMKIPKEELQFHEDAWAGGGNMGPSMEYFSRGLEIGNQVYMQYDITSGEPRELGIKVLDMGMGQERPAWFTCATKTSYEAVFPTVVEKLYDRTGITPDEELLERFLPYSGLLSIDDKADVDKTWELVSRELGLSIGELKNEILPLAAIYSIGDHTRSLLLALSDGALPSNVGGGYNLRALLRRSLDFISKYGWDVSLAEVCEWHAEYLKPQYPELLENLEEVREILEVEERRYAATKRKSRRLVERLRGRAVTLEKLIELYDSNGISPEMLVEEGLRIEVPADFYIRVAERHEKRVQRAQTVREVELDLSGLEKTEVLYYDDYTRVDFEARVLRVLDGKYVVLDRTAFYPTSGGQLHDIGELNGAEVEDVFRQGNVIVHVVKNPSFKPGDKVEGKIDLERRRLLAQHHTATHILNGAARKILGEHIWQAGAEKTPEKARLDITHYAVLSPEEMAELERLANSVVSENLRVESYVLRRDVAEARYGFRLYQGGAVPGKELRVVKIGDLDVEACGGTHLNHTGEVGVIKLIGSTKIQDGVVRLEYVAGEAAKRYMKKEGRIFKKCVKILKEFNYETPDLTVLDPGKVSSYLKDASTVFSVSKEQLPATLEKFLREIEAMRRELGVKALKRLEGDLGAVAEGIFKEWKSLRKKKRQKLAKSLEKEVKALAAASPEKAGRHRFKIGEIKAGMEETVKAASLLLEGVEIVVLFGVDSRISVVGMRTEKAELNMGEVVREACRILGGGGGGKKDFAQGAGFDKGRLEEAKKWVEEYIKNKLH